MARNVTRRASDGRRRLSASIQLRCAMETSRTCACSSGKRAAMGRRRFSRQHRKFASQNRSRLGLVSTLVIVITLLC